MNNLNIIDVSALVHTGHTSDFFSEKLSYNVPVGGLHYLMRQVCVTLVKMDYLVLCFDSPTTKNDLVPTYKTGRVRSPAVYNQIELAYNALASTGIVCEKHDGFEADDIIDWAVAQNYKKFTETVIIGNDQDLAHSVRPSVRFKSIKRGVPCVYCGNFTETAEPGKFIRFNTISAYKALCGCKSDKVPALKISSGVSGDELYRRFIKFIEENSISFTYENTTNPKLLVLFAQRSGLFNQEDVKELIKHIAVVYPSSCPSGVEIKPTNANGVDYTKLAKFCTLIGDSESLNSLQMPRTHLTDADKQMMYNIAKQLNSGVYAADRNLENQEPVPVQTLDLHSFTREF